MRRATLEIGNKFKELRMQSGYGQAELSRLLGVHKSTVLNYEKGRRVPPRDTLFKLKEVLAKKGIIVDLNELLYEG